MDGPISTNETAGSLQQAASITFRSPSLGPPEKVPPVLESNRSRSSARDESGHPERMNNSPAPRESKAETGQRTTRQDPAYFVELRPGEANDTQGSDRTDSSRAVPRPHRLRREDKEEKGPLSADRVSAGPLPYEKEPSEAESANGREAIPLPGDPSSHGRSEVLADALASVKERWAEVNQEVLEAGIPAGRGEAFGVEGFGGTAEASSEPLADPSQDAAPAEGRNLTEADRNSSPADVRFSAKALDPTGTPGEISRGVETDNGLQRQLTSRFESLATSLSNPHPTQPIVDLFV